MQTVIIKQNQTIYDVAVSCYGTPEAISEIIKNNTGLKNEDSAKVSSGIDSTNDVDFYFDLPLKIGAEIIINTDSILINKNLTKEINTDVTTYEL